MANVPQQYQQMVNSAAQQLGISPGIVAQQIFLESSWNPNAVSATGAQGLTQFEPGTWAEFGSGSPFNPQNAMNAYVKFMGSLLRQFGGSVQKALAAYNAGAGNIQAGMGYANQILAASGGASSSSGQTSISQATDNAGVSLNNSPVGAFTSASPSLSLDALRAAAPLVAAVVNAVPELQGIFQQAVAGSWSTDRFISAVQNTTWWSQNSDTMRTALATQKADPATWQQNITNLESNLNQFAAQFGAKISQADINNLAVDALSKGYQNDQAQLRQKFEQFIQPMSGLHFGGEAGTAETQIRDFQNQMGVFLPEGQLDTNVRSIVGGKMSINDVTSALRTQAENTFPAYKNLIQQGMTVSDIANPYINRAQQLLEGGPGMINIQTPMIKKALQNTTKGIPTPMNMGDFETQTRKDPRWVATDNAQNDLMANAHKVLQNFGLQY